MGGITAAADVAVHDVGGDAVRSAVGRVVLAEEVEDAALRVADLADWHALDVLHESCNAKYLIKRKSINEWKIEQDPIKCWEIECKLNQISWQMPKNRTEIEENPEKYRNFESNLKKILKNRIKIVKNPEKS